MISVILFREHHGMFGGRVCHHWLKTRILSFVFLEYFSYGLCFSNLITFKSVSFWEDIKPLVQKDVLFKRLNTLLLLKPLKACVKKNTCWDQTSDCTQQGRDGKDCKQREKFLCVNRVKEKEKQIFISKGQWTNSEYPCPQRSVVGFFTATLEFFLSCANDRRKKSLSRKNLVTLFPMWCPSNSI